MQEVENTAQESASYLNNGRSGTAEVQFVANVLIKMFREMYSLLKCYDKIITFLCGFRIKHLRINSLS